MQSKSTDGPKDGWSCVSGVAAMVAVGHLTTTVDVVWCSAVVVVVVM